MEQIQSAQYSGLLWEDESRTMFRIPWKHAGKQDYNQEIDASIFKVRIILPHLKIVLFFVFLRAKTRTGVILKAVQHFSSYCKSDSFV